MSDRGKEGRRLVRQMERITLADALKQPIRQTKGNASALLGASMQRDLKALRKAVAYALETSTTFGPGEIVVTAKAVQALRKAAKL